LAATVSILIPLTIYILTLARDVTFVDSGELISVAAVLGIAHPPGYPLFCLLGHFFSILPLGSIAFRVGLLSAVAAALTSLLIYLTGLGLLARRLGSSISSDSAGDAPPWIALAPLTGSLLFAFSNVVWSQAVVGEIYALEGLLSFAFLAAALRAFHSGSARAWALSLVFWGLTLTNHLSGVMLFPALIFLLAAWMIRQRRQLRAALLTLLKASPAAVAPLLLYLYLPIRSHANPPVRWDYPETWHRFWVHVSARQYQGLLGHGPTPLEELQRFFVKQLPREANWILPALALLGLGFLVRKSWRLALFLVLAAAGLIAYNILYAIHDISLYYLPVIAILGLLAAVGAGLVARLFHSLKPAAGVAAAILLTLTCVLPLRSHWRDNDYSRFHLLSDYVRDSLKYVEPNAIVYAGNWDAFASPAIYMQVIEGYRPDVLVLGVGKLMNPTLRRILQGPAPDLVEACAGQMDALADVTVRTERREPVDIPEARQLFHSFMDSLVRKSVELRPTYITEEVRRNLPFRTFAQRPEGLVSRLALQDVYEPFPLPEFAGPGMKPKGVRYSEELRVMNDYYRMLRLRAYYERRFGHEEQAKRVEELAERISPWRDRSEAEK